ncbi:NAD(P)/FAD-dependent oxidoreductase [Paremcibacter congregatus]|uniref:NAD(P)/FAD-dependent oxidoreductase n=1 Tax=Paremcibacter congregatus TaxID=2043170 RepID=UPI003A8F02C0
MPQKNKKTIVIGAGIIGVTTAYRLAAAGHTVTLIDRDAPGLGASFGNAGHLAIEQIYPLASPSVLGNIPKMIFDRNGPLVLRPGYFLKFIPWSLRFLWASRPDAFRRGIEATKSLNRAAVPSWTALLDEMALRPMIRQRGSVELFETEAAFAQAAGLVADLERHGVTAHIWTVEQLRLRLPALTGPAAGAIYYPDTAHCINPHRLVTEILAKAEALGLRFVQDEITEINEDEAGTVTLRGKQTSHNCDTVVLSAGVFSRDLITARGKKPPLEAERGYHYMLPDPGITVDLPVTFHERKFILTPMEHGIRLSGTVEFAGTDAPPTRNRARMLFQFAQTVFPKLQDIQGEEWMGFRPTLPDYLPTLDRRGNIISAFGHNHLGLTQAAVTSQLVEDMVEGKAPRLDLTPFGLDRF